MLKASEPKTQHVKQQVAVVSFGPFGGLHVLTSPT